jgi:hypothetical protein
MPAAHMLVQDLKSRLQDACGQVGLQPDLGSSMQRGSSSSSSIVKFWLTVFCAVLCCAVLC